MKSVLAKKSAASKGIGTERWRGASRNSSKKSAVAAKDNDDMIARRAYFDVRTHELVVETARGFVAGLPLAKITTESSAPLASVALEPPGDVVILTHTDGAQTHLPVDMWLPGGFTPTLR
jgi:hypothetical protein